MIFSRKAFLLTSSIIAPSTCVAAPMTVRSKQQLEFILSSEEYQPRSNSSELLESIWKWLSEEAVTFWTKLIESLQNIFPQQSPEFDFSLPPWFKQLSNWLISVLPTLTPFLLVLALIYLVVRYRHLLSSQHPVSAELTEQPRVIAEKINEGELVILAKEGRVMELLCLLRLILRQRILAKGHLQSHLTDREILKIAEMPSIERTIFERAALAFEKSAFAEKAVERNEVESIFRLFQDSGESSRGGL